MSKKVTQIDDYRPHVTERQQCSECGHVQQSVHPVAPERQTWECGKCGQIAARAALGDSRDA